MTSQPVIIFYSYSHKDESFLKDLRTHLGLLRREGVISEWYDRKIFAGDELDAEIDSNLNRADLIILLISSHYLDSDYCYKKEMMLAMERFEDGQARVIPILIRPCDWEGAPFSKLLLLPTDARPVTKWSDLDDAYLIIAKHIRGAVEDIITKNLNSHTLFYRHAASENQTVHLTADEQASSTSIPNNVARFEKIAYQSPSDYLPRRVAPERGVNSSRLAYRRNDSSEDLITVLEQQTRVVLLSNAGGGKTTELKRIASHFSQEGSKLYPLLIPLNTYIDQRISDLLPPSWTDIPEDQLLIILDGLDEIESNRKIDAIRQIEFFSDKHPQAHLLISCRANFYKSETEQSSGMLRGFWSYRLLDLSYGDIQSYIQSQFPSRMGLFNRLISEGSLQALLKIPFYLVNLVQLYKEHDSLPQTKAKVFEELLNRRIRFEEEHLRTTVLELDEKRKEIINGLKRVAVTMEYLGRNYLDDDEFRHVITDEHFRSLLKQYLNKNIQVDKITWQFDHNNLQEYLAATALSVLPLERIKEFISFGPDYKKIIPSWLNTVTFLVSILDVGSPLYEALISWVIDIEPEVLVKCEPERIYHQQRVHIFKSIFDYYKSRQIWIDSDRFLDSELAAFGQSDEVVTFLLDEIEASSHYTTVGNAIDILRYLEIPKNQVTRTTELLLKCALDNVIGEYPQNRALIALSDLGLNSEVIVNQVVSSLRSSENDWVRYGSYYFLHNSRFLDDNIDVFLEGIQYAKVRLVDLSSEDKSRIMDENYHLTIGLEKVKSPQAITKIFRYITADLKEWEDVSFERSIPNIISNAVEAYKASPSIFEEILSFYQFLMKRHMEEEAKDFVQFFDKTGTRLTAFKNLYEKQRERDESLTVSLAALADVNCLSFFIQQYKEHNVTDDDVRRFQNYLSWLNPELFDLFNSKINNASGNKFLLQPYRDVKAEKKQRKQEDLDLLFDKQYFLREVALIYETEEKETLSREELIKARRNHWENPYFSNLAMNTLSQLVRDTGMTFEKVKSLVEKWDWDYFCISRIYEYIANKIEINLSDDRKDYVANWCQSRLDEVDFKQALKSDSDGSFSASHFAIYLWFFHRNLNLDYPKSVLLDMLSFDWVEGHQMAGIEYLEERLSSPETTARILYNLDEGIRNDDVLKNHINYCKRHRVKRIIPFALDVVTDSQRSYSVREVALGTIYDLSPTISDLERILPKITDSFKWEVVKKLLDHKSPVVHSYLKQYLINSDGDEQLKAAKYLIMLQDQQGLQFYAEWVETHRKYPESSSSKPVLSAIKSREAVPLLIKLLRLSYEKEFFKDAFYSLNRAVLDALAEIGKRSEQGYREVRNAIEDFIPQNSGIVGINFLYRFIDRLERSYYITKSEIVSIQGIVHRLDGLGV